MCERCSWLLTDQDLKKTYDKDINLKCGYTEH